jgi:hypothetical protein
MPVQSSSHPYNFFHVTDFTILRSAYYSKCPMSMTFQTKYWTRLPLLVETPRLTLAGRGIGVKDRQEEKGCKGTYLRCIASVQKVLASGVIV